MKAIKPACPRIILTKNAIFLCTNVHNIFGHNATMTDSNMNRILYMYVYCMYIVQFDTCTSDMKSIFNGVPQGSKQGPFYS